MFKRKDFLIDTVELRKSWRLAFLLIYWVGDDTGLLGALLNFWGGAERILEYLQLIAHMSRGWENSYTRLLAVLLSFLDDMNTTVAAYCIYKMELRKFLNFFFKSASYCTINVSSVAYEKLSRKLSTYTVAVINEMLELILGQPVGERWPR